MRKYGAFDSAARGSRSTGGPGAAGGAAPEGFDFSDFSGFGLGDIFSSIFGRARREETREAIETVVEVPFRVAALGGKVPVTLPVTETCRTCHGSGGAPGAKITTCPECNGRGTVTFGQGSFAVSRPCPRCRGRGKTPSEPCPTCHGSGEIHTQRTVMLTVPASTESGARVRLKGQGQSGAAGQPPGDIVVTFQVAPDRFFQRDGLDLICEVPINFAQAALGTRLRVRTIEGKKVVLTDSSRHPIGPEVPDQGDGLGKGWPAGRPAGRGAGDRARAVDGRSAGAAQEIRRVRESGALRRRTGLPLSGPGSGVLPW